MEDGIKKQNFLFPIFKGSGKIAQCVSLPQNGHQVKGPVAIP